MIANTQQEVPDGIVALADAAAPWVNSGTIGVLRGFDQASRERSVQLRARLLTDERSPIDIAPLSTPRLREQLSQPDYQDLCLLVDSGGWPTVKAQRLAALLGLPLLQRPTETTPPATVLGLRENEEIIDVALSDFEIYPSTPEAGQLHVSLDGQELPVSDTRHLRVRLGDGPTSGQLVCAVADDENSAFSGSVLTVDPAQHSFTVLRDGRPVADITRSTRCVALPDRLHVIHP
ncbi:hypothetical protein RIF23_14990 [Lipingzhangella sp. LS1_29]|uniref:Uncharacterized protein n=1 Tax=Lipingzhangella rawalii TaxID=2055835 RepID=A0ABU2H9R2_9ACTN|nr:hypothetical protein [Lipingzhangella rawalii]MDS1271599.1 hypothetical protein [Lipingzhangella rawalii]